MGSSVPFASLPSCGGSTKPEHWETDGTAMVSTESWMPWLLLTFPTAVIASFQHESMLFCLCGPYRAGLFQIMALQLNNCLQLSRATEAIGVNSPGQDMCQVIPISCQTSFL